MKQFIKDLQEYPYIAEEIERLKKELDIIVSDKYDTSTTAKYSLTAGFSGGGVSDKTAEAVLKIVEIYDTKAQSIANKIEKLNYRETRVTDFLDKLDILERSVIKLKYFQNKRWKEIADLTGQSIRNCQRFKDSAFNKIESE